MFNGVSRTSTGIYRDTITNIYGCDSFLTLNLNVSSIIVASQTLSVCSPGSIVVGSSTYSVSGVYSDTTSNSAGCDSVIVTTVEILPTVSVSLQPTICSNESYSVGTHIYNTTGVYFDTLISINGCDSFIRTSLNVLPISTLIINSTICSNESYTIGTSVYNLTGTYYDTLLADNGCDSIVRLNLIVLPTSTFTRRIDICSDETFYAGGLMQNTSGTYLDTILASNGCDSFLITNLFVHSLVYTTLNPVICSGESFNVSASRYTSTGTYYDTLFTIWGCDSVITTNLTVNPTNNTLIDTTICFGDIIRIGTSIIHNTSGTYYDTLNNIYGCDSAIQTILIVLPVNINVIDTTICEGHYYLNHQYYNDSTYNDTLRYIITQCDSFVTIHNINVIYNDSVGFIGDTIICIGDSTRINASGGDNTNYYWWPNTMISCVNCQSPIFYPTSNTTYYCMSFGPCGDTLISSVTIIVNPLPIVIAYSDTTIIYTYGAPIYAEASGFGSLNFDWYNMNGLQCSNCQYTVVYPDRSQPYYVIVQEENGCVNRDSVFISVNYECSDSLIEVPNLMTPNDDGANDYFRFINPENIPINSLRIFNRWGEMMFESFSPTEKWDGTYQGQPVNSGVYVYVIEGGCPFNKFMRKGNVTLIR
jgi:gliding motility-associated-like protein